MDAPSAGGAGVGGGRVHLPDLWGDEDDAWVESAPGGRAHRHRRERRDSGPLVSDAGGPPDYLELPVGSFLDLTASSSSAPGGGSAIAVSVALAAGLSSMAARLSTKQLTDAAGLAERAEGLRERVAPLARADAVAYGRVLVARRAREAPDRDRDVRAALSEAADVPLAMAEAGAEVASIAARLAGEGNPNL